MLSYSDIAGKEFVLLGDIIIDVKAELAWPRDANLAKRQFSWEAAESYCKELKIENFESWRLPTLPEIKGLLAKKNIPAENIMTIYWTSTVSADWHIASDSDAWHQNNTLSVWPVCELTGKIKYIINSAKEKKLRHELELEAQKSKLHNEIETMRKQNYLGINSFFKGSCGDILSRSNFEDINVKFIVRLFSQYALEDDKQLNVPDLEQALTISEVWQNTLVVARAGSGKTSTIVNRAYFLQKHCGVSSDEMLLLAFNRKAAKEMAERLEKLSGDSAAPHVMTFHALAHAVVNPSQDHELVYNDASEANQGLDSIFSAVTKDRLQEDWFLSKVRKLMLSQFKQDWEEIVEGGYDLSPKELYRFQKNLARETLRGEYVKSHGEKVIANFLFEHSIPYIYEKIHYKPGTPLHPDFTIPPLSIDSKEIIIEYFGLAGSDSDYDWQMEEKCKFFRSQERYLFIELYKDFFVGGDSAFEQILKQKLEAAGVTCNRASDEQIWLNIKPRAIKRFSSAISGFVGRCRKAWLLPDKLAQIMSEYKPILDSEACFLELALVLYNDYLDRLAYEKKQDFDGLMQLAATAIESGTTTFMRKGKFGDLAKLRYIFIDEYQDFSELFQRIIDAIRLHKPDVNFFCVGDDWQAINRFAGANLKFYQNFEKYFPQSRRLYISTNYRSNASIVQVGNALMDGRGKPSVASNSSEGVVHIVNLSNFSPTLIEEEVYKNGILTPVLLRLIHKGLKGNKSVVLLNHRKEMLVPSGGFISIENYLVILRKRLPEQWRDRLTISTAHGFKGKEADVVIIMDAFERIYPLIHPNWIFSRILGENLNQIDDENRRLFYVALTRAKEQLFIVTDNDKRSPYLDEIESHYQISEINWGEFPPITGAKNSCVVRISGRQFFSLTDGLNADGFRFRRDNGAPVRDKKFDLKELNIGMLQKTPWALRALSDPESNFIVSVLNDLNEVVESYQVVAGHWQKQKPTSSHI